MRTYLGKFVNREHEVHILDIIGDYCSSFVDCRRYKHFAVMARILPKFGYYRLRFYITKRKHIGQIYVEQCWKGKQLTVEKRKYLKQSMWRKIQNETVVRVQYRLTCTIEQLEQANIDTAAIKEQIEICKLAVEDWHMNAGGA